MSGFVRPVGPVDIMVVGFAENRFDGSIAPALAELVARGLVRVLDMVVVSKDMDGTVSFAELSELGGGALELGVLGGDIPGLIGEDDERAIGEQLAPGSTAAIVAWENTWAIRTATAVRGAGGVVLAHERIPAADVDAVLTALEEQDAAGALA